MQSFRTNKLEALINHISTARRSTPPANQNSDVARLQASHEASRGTADTLQTPPRIRPRWCSDDEIGRRAVEVVAFNSVPYGLLSKKRCPLAQRSDLPLYYIRFLLLQIPDVGINYSYGESRYSSDKIANVRISVHWIQDGLVAQLRRPPGTDHPRPAGVSSGMQYAIGSALWRVDNVLGRNFISDVPTGDRNYEY